VDVQNSGTNTLFVAGIPEFVNIDTPRLFLTQEESLRVPMPPAETLRYEVSAHSGPPLGWPLSRAERSRYLQLPAIDARIEPLARNWSGDGGAEESRAGEGGAMDRARGIERHLRGDFKYVLDGPRQPVSDPLADFLFVRKEGYCEYFASAMAVMLRIEGIPARVATGFVNGYYNDVSGLTVVRASDAHAWVEAWIEGQGWTTFDPTPAGTDPVRSGLLSRLGMYSDALDHAWREWVVSYDLSQQVAMAARFEGALRGLKSIEDGSRTRWITVWASDWKQWGWWALAAIGWIAGTVLTGPRLWKKWRRREHLQRVRKDGGSPADASVLYDRMLENLRRRGIDKPVSVTPLEFARRLPAEERPWVLEFTTVYNRSRFGADAQAAARLAAMIEERETAN
jgi:transglutaminase-like putative cysteine protease